MTNSFMSPENPGPVVSYIERLHWRLRSRRDIGVDGAHPGWVTDILDTNPAEGMSISRKNDGEWQLLIYRKGGVTTDRVIAEVLGSFATDDDAKAAAAEHIAKGPIPR